MSSKLTELTESSPSVLCGSGILSQLASSGHLDPSQTYDGYKAVEVLDPACTKFGGKPIYSSSEVPISNINTEGVVKRIRYIASSPPDPDSEGSDQLDGEEVEVVHNSIGHEFSTSPSHPPAKIFQSHIIPTAPRAFQPTCSPDSPSSSTTRTALIPAVRPSPIVTSQQLQPVARYSRRREGLSPFPFPATEVFQQRENWPIQVTREDPNTERENKDAVSRFLRRVDRNSGEVIEYSWDCL
ncbi:hypothetical protein O181_015076 [Austropuccinia psidii MF-1]|uniref:Uncharacterized protein n=1 Tax=Austropuccinia psidii MF-1 TaxID=1389203 RepID=A0A9Q3GPR8_9BASI|nr:hypothetical protein [Austropuccinia psidii MF-1]